MAIIHNLMQDRLEISKARNVTGLRLASEWAGEPGIMPRCREIQIYLSSKESPLQRTDAAAALSESSLCVYCTCLLSQRKSASPNLIVMQHGRSFVGNCK